MWAKTQKYCIQMSGVKCFYGTPRDPIDVRGQRERGVAERGGAERGGGGGGGVRQKRI